VDSSWAWLMNSGTNQRYRNSHKKIYKKGYFSIFKIFFYQPFLKKKKKKKKKDQNDS
jgi:hypothetical protein